MMKPFLLLSCCAVCLATPAIAAELIDQNALNTLVDARIKVIDTSGDGLISKDEYLASAAKKFADNDLDHNGMISRTEFMNIKMKEVKDLTASEKKQ